MAAHFDPLSGREQEIPWDAGVPHFCAKKTWLKSGGGQLDSWKQLRKDRGKNTAIDFER
jgi:hypothetical protein